MRKIFLLLLLIIGGISFATVRTVNNQTAGGAQFSTIQAAVDASANGDTIYVHSSPISYATFSVTDKKLTIIGPGWAPDKQIALQAIIDGCTLINSPAAGSPSGSELQGLVFNGPVNFAQSVFAGGSTVDNLRIIRCQFNNNIAFSVPTSNDLFEGCIFKESVGFATFAGAGVAGATNVLFQNNLFLASGMLSNLIDNISNIRVDHNLFYGSTSAVFPNSRFLTITNNIFINRNVPSGLSSSTFNNNITFLCGTPGNTPWAVNSNVDAGGNVANQSPQMVDEAAVEAGNSSPLLNFTIPNGPANNTGSDGKDMGLLFDATGSLNWANSRNSRIPRIFSMNITTPTVSPGANISVTVDARKSN